MKPLEYHVEPDGPLVTHDFPCPVYGCPKSAVLNLSEAPSEFHPCWEHQKAGYRMVKTLGWRRTVMNWLYPIWPDPTRRKS